MSNQVNDAVIWVTELKEDIKSEEYFIQDIKTEENKDIKEKLNFENEIKEEEMGFEELDVLSEEMFDSENISNLNSFTEQECKVRKEIKSERKRLQNSAVIFSVEKMEKNKNDEDNSYDLLFNDEVTLEVNSKTCNDKLLEDKKNHCSSIQRDDLSNDQSCKAGLRLCLPELGLTTEIMDSQTTAPSSSSCVWPTEYEISKERIQKRNALGVSDAKKIIFCDFDGNISEFEDDDDGEVLEALSMSQSENEDDYLAKIQQMADVEIEESSEDDIEASSEDDEENIPHSNFKKNVDKTKTDKIKNDLTCNWQKIDFEPPCDLQWKDCVSIDESWINKPPLFFFSLIFDDVLIKHIVDQTVKYALQKDGKELRLSVNEMKSFLGILMLTGIIKVPTYRTYWKSSLRIDPITNAMSRDRFEEVKRYLHFNDNAAQKLASHPAYDKLKKIRPLLDAVRINCNITPQEEQQCIDEQIIPTKAPITLRQYNPKKSHKWGYKVFARSGASGYIYDFEIYTGNASTPADDSGFGVSSSVVMRLAEGIPKHSNYKLYYDDWFSSVNLAKKLKDDGIYILSTIRPNRLRGCSLKEEKQLKKEGRGAFDYRVETMENIIAIKWYDNKPVHCLSTYAGIYPMSDARRWDSKKKEHITIPRPQAITEYNKFMGGVDLCDMLIKLYRIDFKSKKWYMRIFFYLMDLAVVNAWLLYRRVWGAKRKCLPLCAFKEDVSIGLMSASTTHTPERGRPSTSESMDTRKKRKKSCHPAESVRTDNCGHLPSCVKTKRRCKECVEGFTRVICVKCNVGLCLTNKRNCYMKYHQR